VAVEKKSTQQTVARDNIPRYAWRVMILLME